MSQDKFFSYGEMDFIRQGEGIKGSVSAGDDGTANRVPSKVAKNTIYLRERLDSLDNSGSSVLTLEDPTSLDAGKNYLVKKSGDYTLPDSAVEGSFVNVKSSGVKFKLVTNTVFPNDSKSLEVKINQSVQLIKNSRGWEFARLNGGESWTRPQSDSRYVMRKVFTISNDSDYDNWYVVASGSRNLNSRFKIESDSDTSHRSVVVEAGVSYGQKPSLNLLANVSYGSGDSFSKIKITSERNVDPTYSKKYLIVQIKARCSVTVAVEDLGGLYDEWETSDGTVGASSTTTLLNCELDLTSEGLMTNREIRAEGLYDSGTRVYSPSNRVPWSDSAISGRPLISKGTTGSRGSVQVEELKNGWAGYSILGKHSFLSDGKKGFGIFEEDGGWLIQRDSAGDVSLGAGGVDYRLVLRRWTLHYKTDYGYAEIGPQNAGHCHLMTDRPSFYFNKPIQVESSLEVYNGGDTSLSHRGVYDHGYRVYSPHNKPTPEAIGAMRNAWGGLQLSGDLNRMDGPVDYALPQGAVMVGLHSWHSNNTEDRVWRIYYRYLG